MNNNSIDFLGIGAHKSGTTWLHYQLSLMSGFHLLPIKEIHYFDREKKYSSASNALSEKYILKRLFNYKWTKEAVGEVFSKVISGDFHASKFYWKWYFSNYDDNWYLSLFNNGKGYKGEISPSYAIIDEVGIRKMYEVAPNAKIILMVRNPIDRAWSHFRYYHTRKNQRFSFKDFEHDDILRFIKTEAQLLRSDYIRAIDNYSRVYPKDQILVGFYDAIVDDPVSLLSGIVNFITGNIHSKMSSAIEVNKKVNVSKQIERPVRIEEELKNMYYSQIKELSDAYGGYFNQWFEKTYQERSENQNSELLPTISIAS